eukprot:9386-Heterococcus_DN1.PRE.1
MIAAATAAAAVAAAAVTSTNPRHRKTNDIDGERNHKTRSCHATFTLCSRVDMSCLSDAAAAVTF